MTTEASDGEKRLYEYLFVTVGYNNEVRPRRDPTQSIVVDVELDLNHLIKLVRKFGIISVTCTCFKQAHREGGVAGASARGPKGGPEGPIKKFKLV